VEALRLLDAAPEVELVGAVTAPPRPAGRGGNLTATPVSTVAAELGIRYVLSPDRLRDPQSIAAVSALEPELLVLADYGRLVPADLLDPRFGALNLHPSLLPRHRGASPIAATILAGDTETGVTLMKMDAGLDTGPIVAQTRVALTGRETAPLLEARLAGEAASLLSRSLGPWIRGELRPTPQPAEGASLTKPLRREDGRLDPARSAVDLERRVRALQPWPGTFVDTVAGRIKVLRAVAASPLEGAARERREPGTFGPGPELRLHTIEGDLVLTEVQPASGRAMTGEALVLGRPALPGSTTIPA
jgi:methionyl-tRNA formyltransferase